MMRFLFFLFLIPAMIFSAESASTYKSYLQNSQKNQGSILDYFLVCTQCGKNFGGNGEEGFEFRQQLINKKNARYFFRGESGHSGYEREVVVNEVILDIKNGYIQIKGVDDERSVIYSAALYMREDKSKIIALTYFQEGGDGETIEYLFFDVSSAKWTNITQTILPDFSLSDFASDRHDPTLPEFNKLVEWEIQLPRYGTTAYLIPIPGYKLSEGSREKYEAYTKLVIQNKLLPLQWDGKAGKFIKGKLLLRVK